MFAINTVLHEVCVCVYSAPRAYHGCVCLDGLLYIIGGFDGMEYFNSVRRFNPKTKTWTEVAPMYYRRQAYNNSL